MGIRVHKVIGYGISDLAYKEDKEHYSKVMTDGRINWKMFNKLCHQAYDVTPTIFTKWLENNWDEILKLEAEERCVSLEDARALSSLYMPLFKDCFKRNKSWKLSNCCVYEDEGGLANVIVFVPPIQISEWKRFDDVIDWIEETKFYGGESRVVELACSGIYPYDSQMIRFGTSETKSDIWPKYLININERDGMRCDDNGVPKIMMAGDYNRLIGRWDPKVKPEANGEFFRHLKNNWRPQIPSELLAVLLWFKDCFNDFNKLKNSLRPLLYVYWS